MSTPYINPFELAGFTPQDEPDNEMLLKKKKRLLAQVKLSESQTVWHKGVELSGDDIQKAFESLQTEKVWQYQKELLDYPELCDFMASGNPAFFNKKQQINPELKNFISGWYSEQFSRLLVKQLSNKGNEKKTITLVQRNILDEPEYMQACYYASYVYLQKIKASMSDISVRYTLDGINDKDILDIRDFFVHTFEQVSYSEWNILPHLFSQLRNEFASSAWSLCMRIMRNKKYETFGAALLKYYVTKLFCSDRIGLLIESFKKENQGYLERISYEWHIKKIFSKRLPYFPFQVNWRIALVLAGFLAVYWLENMKVNKQQDPVQINSQTQKTVIQSVQRLQQDSLNEWKEEMRIKTLKMIEDAQKQKKEEK